MNATNRPNAPVGVCLFLVGLGFLCVAIGVRQLVRQVSFGRAAVATRGTVVSLRAADPHSSEHPTYYPTVEFRIDDGRSIRFEDRVATNPHPQLGDAVSVLYRPSEPQDARIDSLVRRWLIPTALIPFGSLAMWLGVWILRVARRANEE
ncbi:MAG: DUF3592 domain-containing protein [Pirellulales bacterium]